MENHPQEAPQLWSVSQSAGCVDRMAFSLHHTEQGTDRGAEGLAPKGNKQIPLIQQKGTDSFL